MRLRREAGIVCPRCRQFCYRMTGGVLSKHRTEMLAIGSNRREWCPYGGGTIQDAKDRITPIRRRRMDRESGK